MKITTLPVYSRLYQPGSDQFCPVNSDGCGTCQAKTAYPASTGPCPLSQHQVETVAALLDPNVDVVFNTAMTGDGKSLAAYLRALRDSDHVIAMYPTNELICDQASKMPDYLSAWGVDLPYHEMYAAKITEMMADTDTDSRVEQMRKLLDQNAILLTNPDLFHLMMNFKLKRQDWERKELPFAVSAYFDYFVFDEFHIFGAPQVVDVTNVINYLAVHYQHKPADRKKFLFLSATPSSLMHRLLEQSGLRFVEIEGQYSHEPDPGWRQILQKCTLYLDHVDRDRTTEEWIKEHLPEIVRFFQDYPGSKGAIIVNSVATAKRIHDWLRNNLPQAITLGENTGLTSYEERRASFDRHLMVATSTVDIGVDFHINLLIFEATGAGTFIQRFGRLGRHLGFGDYRAYALLPKFIIERFQTALGDQEEVERTTFNQAVNESYPQEQEFLQYARRWGILQTAHLIARVENALPKGHPLVPNLIERFNHTFGVQDFGRMVRRYWAMSKNEAEEPILDELTSFRGLSPLSCGLWDLTDDHLKRYDLFFLLVNTEFEVISEEEFMAEVRRRGLPERDFRYQLLFFRVTRYLTERQHFTLGLKRDLCEEEERLHQIQVLKGFYVKESRQPWVDAVNKILKKQKLVCVISDRDPYELKRSLWLPLLFPVYRLSDLYDSEFAVAFGKEALLLESLLFYRKTGGDRPIFTWAD